MTPGDRAVFVAYLATMGEVFDRATTDVLIEAYWVALEDLPLGELKEAAREIVKSEKFFPRPVTWRERTLDVLRARREVAKQRHLMHALREGGDWDDKRARLRTLLADLRLKLGWR